ncbi:type I 3-dehydroquinate dehydratase [Oceanobacillus sp. J11TS1]|uniref:type I 3-dehydroquinate dehydratase n=1 Tax=Oceanobacillus sp. J11TS1 TaxID=2807191 RepID=UPI001B1B48A9|nr:type I 3-dehydroquinate dehydratase [Oceanobacillus sp. J11TS1]GIO23342.1 3-dehydroquinate dehydratase [Oceanobacillus sp. J11TS1]
MTKTLTVKNLTLGNGKPRVCIPLTSSTKESIVEEAHRYRKERADVVEWRADLFEEVENHAAVEEVLTDLVATLKDTPLIFTFRSHLEGGEKELSKDEYIALNEFVIQTGLVDFVDVELYQGEETVKNLISLAHQQHTYVIISNHDFQKTPPKSEIIRRLQLADELGGDVLKIAVMPNRVEDVLELLTATNEIKKDTDKPIITMAMGPLGVITRLSGHVFGSVLTFGAGEKASAPGQIPIQELRQVLEIMGKSMNDK